MVAKYMVLVCLKIWNKLLVNFIKKTLGVKNKNNKNKNMFISEQNEMRQQ